MLKDIDLHSITVLSSEWRCEYAATWNQSNYKLVERYTFYSICQFAWGNTSWFLIPLTAKNHILTISIWYAYFLNVDFMVNVTVLPPSREKYLLKTFGQSVIPALLFLFFFGKVSGIFIYQGATSTPQTPLAPFFLIYFIFRYEWRLTLRVLSIQPVEKGWKHYITEDWN